MNLIKIVIKNIRITLQRQSILRGIIKMPMFALNEKQDF
ncbi:MAG: hypothetical protein JWR54_3147 [Mucilaginibacter sp.]|jgi:hypothetical protein|nr:hypothetical protein [Mucilaginibacter sp.]